MAAIAGKGGSVKIGANTVAEIQNWSVDVSAEMLEDTALGDSWKSNIPGLLSWSGSLDGNFAIQTDTNGQTALQTAALAGTTVSLKLYVNSTNYYSGDAYISGLSIETAVDGTVTASFDFDGTGALTYA